MLVVGIDPGLSGAIAILGDIQVVMKLPVNDKDIDIGVVADWLIQAGINRIDLALIEKVGAMPKQGVASMFRFGYSTGQLTGMIQTLKIPLVRPTPQAWKKVVLAGTSKDKDAAIAYVRNRYPHLSLLPTERSRVPDDGMADAVCIAEYGLWMLTKKPIKAIKAEILASEQEELWG